MGNCFGKLPLTRPQATSVASDADASSQTRSAGSALAASNVVPIVRELTVTSPACQERAQALRNTMRKAREQRQREELTNAAEIPTHEAPIVNLNDLLAKHGFVLTDGAVGFTQKEETELKNALAVLMGNCNAPAKPWPSLRSAFIFGKKEKIEAAFVLHRPR